jgi:dsDNA-binding SOS-regulon protein
LRQQWDENYDSVLAFAKEHNHLDLPYKDADTRCLYYWLNRQKKRKYVSNDERDKLALLEEYGYEGDSNQADKQEKVWTNFFNNLVEYKRVHGRFVVSKTDADSTKLSGWISRRRFMGQRGSLLPERRQRLVDVGFDFHPTKAYNKKTRFTEQQETKWDEMYDKLCDFKQHYGHCRVPFKDESHEPLARWVASQRFHGCGKMDETRRQRLGALNFTWSVREDSSHAAANDAGVDDAVDKAADDTDATGTV